jgi:transposase
MKRIARKATRFVGLDVHAQTISVAIAEKNGEVRSIGNILNGPRASRGSWRNWTPAGRG